MDEALLQKIEQLARLLLTPSEIGSLLGLNAEQVAALSNPWSDAGKMYRRILAERAKDLHEKTLRLADVGSPPALEKANEWLRSAQISIE